MKTFCAETVSSIEFTVRRSKPELVGPARPTPRELKPLSDIDDQDAHRYLIPIVHFYRHSPPMQGKDPATVMRRALAQALVFYYPLAGRLREGPSRKLSVDCTGEGILLIEADADVELARFGDPPRPPFPCYEELLCNVPPSMGILNSPLLYIQVTRLKCGGFVVGLSVNHTVIDASGVVQFLAAVAQIAQGAGAPSVTPVWCRHFFSARDPPRVTCTHLEYGKTEDLSHVVQSNHYNPDDIHRSFFFGPSDLAAIRKLLPEHLRSRATTFEVLTACLWRCHTIALQYDPKDEVRLLCVVNARRKFNPVMDVGYYGNAYAVPVAATTAGKLCRSPVEYAWELVRKAKEEVTEEYMRSVTDLMVIRGRPRYGLPRSLIVSDVTQLGFHGLDFGWGEPAYSGPGRAEAEGSTFYVPFEDGILIPLCLRAQAMERFEVEMSNILLPRRSSI